MQISLFTQVLSFSGAVLVLAGYAGAQFHWLHPQRIPYNVLNAAGAAILVAVALRPFQLGFVVMEGAWVVISLYALVRVFSRRSRTT
jgi:predicted benzoate:H+ symporter BenE